MLNAGELGLITDSEVTRVMQCIARVTSPSLRVPLDPAVFVPFPNEIFIKGPLRRNTFSFIFFPILIIKQTVRVKFKIKSGDK